MLAFRGYTTLTLALYILPAASKDRPANNLKPTINYVKISIYYPPDQGD